MGSAGFILQAREIEMKISFISVVTGSSKKKICYGRGVAQS